ncbi:MAG: hypothetical protein ED557_10670 [Balneola sp.]|nr:MAG: hypothetical protein ED557_10670 [Balneola sp.]
MAFVFWSMFSKKGKGRMLGGSIIHTSSEEIIQTKGIAKSVIRTHVVEAKNGSKHIGIELSENAKLAASMTPIKLTKEEAQKLVRMITEVANRT